MELVRVGRRLLLLRAHFNSASVAVAVPLPTPFATAAAASAETIHLFSLEYRKASAAKTEASSQERATTAPRAPRSGSL